MDCPIPESPPAQRPFAARALRSAVATLLFVAGFALVAWFLRPAHPSDAMLRAKLEYFSDHKDEFDFVFFGSSRIFRCFVSDEFDREMKRRGHSIRSFNFGLQFQRPHEMAALIDQVLEMKPARLRYVAVELMHWVPTILEATRSHERTIDWHTPSNTWSACRTIWLLDKTHRNVKDRNEQMYEITWAQKVEWWSTHVSNMCAKYLNYGGGVRWLMTFPSKEPSPERWYQRMQNNNGFIALDEETEPVYQARYERFREHFWDIFLEQIRQAPIDNARPVTLDHFNVRAIRDQQARIEQAGAMPVYIIPTIRDGTPVLHQLKQQNVVSHMLTYNHPLKYPRLYRRDRYWDRRHMNRLGAGEFTQVLAADLAALMDQQ